MQVIVAEHAGTCFGVERALRLADEALCAGGTACSLGPLIHNTRVVDDLAAKGLAVATSVEGIVADPVVIRSHGITPEESRALDALGLKRVDATCPLVRNAQMSAERLGSRHEIVVVVGEAAHPEVRALCAYVREAGGYSIPALVPEDLPAHLPDSVGVVVQTTQRAAVLDRMLDALAARGIEVDLARTICKATTLRQDAALEVARRVDAMVVVGGRHSSNTARLAEICAGVCPRVFAIEGPDELEPEQFAGCAQVGLTAGASTPAYQIHEVLSCLEGF